MEAIPLPTQPKRQLPEKRLVSVPEAATLLSISHTKAWQMVYSGQIPSIQIGRRRLVPVKALDEWIDRQIEEAM